MKCSIDISLKSDSVAWRRPFRCYCLNVQLKDLRSPIPKASTRQLHITDNFTLVEREMRAYLSCGILACGFLRLKCESCGKDRLLPLSCKGRSVCPSCCGRRMVDTAAHLVDRVFPRVPVRQWVLSLPFALRYRLAYDSTMTTAVLQVFIRSLFGLYRRMARDYGIDQTQCGAVTFVQRFGSAANLNLHFHVIF